MEVAFRESFYKDIKNCTDKVIKRKVAHVINEVELAENAHKIKDIKKLKGFKSAYRIKLKDYRIGVEIIGDKLTFIRMLHRKEVYRFFP